MIVPTEVLKNQWIQILGQENLIKNCSVEIINSVIKKTYVIDLLVIDECHRLGSDSFATAFKCVTYKFILCLTATLSRLDEKEWIIKQYAPICDEVTLSECKKNGWIANFSEYKVLIDVDMTEYNTQHRIFTNHFAFFDYDFNKAMSIVSDYNRKLAFARETNQTVKEVSLHAAQFIKSLKARKSFVQNHPRKVEVAREIIKAFPDRKIITFSQTAKMAESIGIGSVYHSKIPTAKRSEIIKLFNESKSGVINSVKALTEGVDVKGLNVGISICGNSSQINRRQSLGRSIRKSEDDTEALMFHLIINNSMEEEWFRRSSKGLSYTTVYEDELSSLLNGNLSRPEINNEDVISKHLFRF